MHARVSTYQGRPVTEEQMAEILQQQQDTLLPKIRSMAGFKGVLSLVDHEAGKAISVTLWESAEAMAASEADANTIRDQAADIAAEEVRGVERYAVGFLELP